LSPNTEGTATILFTVIVLSMLTIAMTTYMTFSNTIEDFGRKTALQQQFNDIGNSLANDVMSIVIFLPHGGEIRYSKDLPNEIAGNSYTVELNSTEERITLRSSNYAVNFTIGGISHEINGSINSTLIVIRR